MRSQKQIWRASFLLEAKHMTLEGWSYISPLSPIAMLVTDTTRFPRHPLRQPIAGAVTYGILAVARSTSQVRSVKQKWQKENQIKITSLIVTSAGVAIKYDSFSP